MDFSGCMEKVNFPNDGHNIHRYYLTKPGKLNSMATDDINPIQETKQLCMHEDD